MSTKPPQSSGPASLRTPPEGGSGKYVAVMLVLAVGMGGLFAWRHFQSEPVDVAPAPSTSVAVLPPPPPRQDLDIPPPPPLPDATPDTGALKPPTSTGGGGDGCGQTSCSGGAGPELRAALAFRAKTAHKCYDEALALDSTLKGQVVIGVRVGYSGAVCAASVVSSDLANPSVAPCIANRFRQGARLPSPTGGCTEVNVPISLLPPH